MTQVKAYDFRRTETLDRQSVRVLSAAFDTFSRHGSVELSTSLRKLAQLSVVSLRELTWRALTEELGERPYLATFTLEPLHGTVVLSLSLSTAIRMLDFRLGGGTQPPFERHTDMTETDFAVLDGVVRPLLAKLSSSFSRMKEVSATLVSQESSIQFVQLAAAAEMFLVARFDLALADDEPTVVTLALPFALVQQLTDALHSESARNDVATLVNESVVLQAPLEVALELPAVPLSSTQVAELQVGDVICFYHPLHQPLALRAGGVLVARAAQGAIGSKVVCSILEEVSTNDD